MSNSRESWLRRGFQWFRHARCGVFFLGTGGKHIYAKSHEAENIAEVCHCPRRLFQVICAMICVRQRDQGLLIGNDVDSLAEYFDRFANEHLRAQGAGASSVKSFMGLLDLPSRIEGELNALGLSRVIFLPRRDRCHEIRENLRRFSGLTGFHFVFEG